MRKVFFIIGIIFELVGMVLCLGAFGGLEYELTQIAGFLGFVAGGIILCFVGHFFIKSAIEDEWEED